MSRTYPIGVFVQVKLKWLDYSIKIRQSKNNCYNIGNCW